MVHAPPAPLPAPALNARALRLAVVAMLPAAALAGAFWLLAGQVFQMPVARWLVIAMLAGVLAAMLAAVLEGQLLWPLTWRGPLSGATTLPMMYGLGGALTVLPGAALIGVLVLTNAFELAIPGMPVIIAGAAAGFFYVIFALPPGLLVGVLTGRGLGALAGLLGRRRGLGASVHFTPAALARTTWAASLAWFLAGSVAGSVVGTLVAIRADLDPAAGAYVGGLAQTIIAALLLPLAIRLLRRGLILVGV